MTTAEAEEMAALARQKRVPTAIGLQARCDPTLRYVRDLIAQLLDAHPDEVIFTSGGYPKDHLAAIADLTGYSTTRRRRVLLATMYALGHAAVVFLLGVAFIVLGASLPAAVDAVMERAVPLGAVRARRSAPLAWLIITAGMPRAANDDWPVLGLSWEMGAVEGLLERARGEQPLVQFRPPHAQRVVEVLVGAGSVSVQRDGEALHAHAGHGWPSPRTERAPRLRDGGLAPTPGHRPRDRARLRHSATTRDPAVVPIDGHTRRRSAARRCGIARR